MTSLQTTAQRLTRAYHALDEAKYHRTRPEVHVAPAPPGPRPPATGWALHLDADLVAALLELVRNLAEELHAPTPPTTDGARLAHWIATHADTIIHTIDWVDDLEADLDTQVTTIERHVGTQATPPAETTPQLAAAIIQLAAQQGVTVTRPQLRQWAHRGHISSYTIGGRAHYLLGDVITYATTRDYQ